jgi:hypothetical protein
MEVKLDLRFVSSATVTASTIKIGIVDAPVVPQSPSRESINKARLTRPIRPTKDDQ